MATLPERAGLASLRFESWQSGYGGMSGNDTRRAGSDITLVTTKTSVFVPLNGGVQFLFAENGEHPREVFFGGTDERPFLVPLEPEVLEIYGKRGETGFFEAIKPRRIRELEKQFGREHTKRQGDIFAFPVLAPDPRKDRLFRGNEVAARLQVQRLELPPPGTPLSWWQTIELMQARGHRLPPEELVVDYNHVRQSLNVTGWQRVFGTRHLLDGTSITFGRTSSGDTAILLVAEGVLYNSDHPALVLEGPHVMGQTAMIAPWQSSAEID
ncbi:MAG: hypothetical protein HYS89_02385 [Candidatus Colwellbacteria bacterium]|nr:hypothetical protein [Candidatus Colwellbacteria bacterium]